MPVARRGPAPYTGPMLHPPQIRAARALLNWSQRELAAAAGISEITVKKIELRGGGHSSTHDAIRQAFANAGVEFIFAGARSLDGGAGVRLAPSASGASAGSRPALRRKPTTVDRA
ncbi:MAG: helix-turn-helix transcriptional regulator [Rhizorhabdus sp.]|uniref:helix-turn-helix domain-containing protein n=1 Tax=Rhizorhabdus sp. TaxID=1968843 RepID=UPI001B6EBC68|nr:helix-turn-helix transcriptional regulator [Rhizorhabdus sp.]